MSQTILVYNGATVALTFACAACGAMATGHPHRVPSIVIDGERQAICRACFARWNAIHRTSKGLPPVPLLDGAYGPCGADEL